MQQRVPAKKKKEKKKIIKRSFRGIMEMYRRVKIDR